MLLQNGYILGTNLDVIYDSNLRIKKAFCEKKPDHLF